jgi:hypothetical protein
VKHKVVKEVRNVCHAFHWPDSRMSSSCFRSYHFSEAGLEELMHLAVSSSDPLMWISQTTLNDA